MAQEKELQTKAPDEKKDDIRALIQSDTYRRQFAIALPKHLKPERFIRVALTAMTKNPKLAQCTKASLISCLLDLSALGLEPDGRRAHLIPYKNNATGDTICTLIVDYKGLVELAMNTKEVSNIHADIVCENDDFLYNKGEVERHEIDFKKDRGKMYAAYCIITMKDGTKKAEVMTKEEVDAIRKRSKAASNGPWVTDYNEMAKKTVFRRASKWIKLSPEVREKIEKDDDPDLGDIATPPAQPVIELKNDKNKPVKQEAAPAEIADPQPGNKPTSWNDFGDIDRFGKENQAKAKNLIGNLTKCAERLGKDKFLTILGAAGWDHVQTITKVVDLTALLNKMLEDIKAQE